MKGFGCRPGASDRSSIGGRRRKASEEGTRGKAMIVWRSMGIWRGSGVGEGWFSRDRQEMKAADDCALAAAAVLDGVIEDQPTRPCRRWRAPE